MRAVTAQEMIFPGAPRTVKMACGENPKGGNDFPTTKMGNVSGYREAFIAAAAYRNEWDEWLADYLDEQDKAFLEFLKADWEAFQAMQGIKADAVPKPPTIPHPVSERFSE